MKTRMITSKKKLRLVTTQIAYKHAKNYNDNYQKNNNNKLSNSIDRKQACIHMHGFQPKNNTLLFA